MTLAVVAVDERLSSDAWEPARTRLEQVERARGSIPNSEWDRAARLLATTPK